jgi:hypothetical protein
MPPTQRKAPEQKPEFAKPTIGGHQGHWVPMSQSLVILEEWSKAPRNAWRVLWWMTNRMTGCVKYEDDTAIYGVVAGGNPVSYSDIAKDLHCSWSAVQRSIQWLGNNGLIACGRARRGDEYRYQVINSIRQFDLVTIPGDNPWVGYQSPPEADEQMEFLDESKVSISSDGEPTDFLLKCDGCGEHEDYCVCAEKQTEFLDESKVTSFDIEAEDDTL